MGTRRERFRTWRRSRPFVGGLLVVIAGIEMFFSGQLDLGNIQIQFGLSGLQATIIPAVLVLLGVLVTTMPQHRVFYGVIALALSVYSLVGVNLGGFVVGMLLGAIGGVLVVAWMPRAARGRAADDGGSGAEASTSAVGSRASASGAGAEACTGAEASPAAAGSRADADVAPVADA